MNRRNGRPRSPRTGLTIVELAVATSIFVVVGYALFGAVEMGRNSQQTVLRSVSSNSDIREANSTLIEELKTGGETTVVVDTLGDGNHQLTFMQRIEVGGSLEWGVFDESLGVTPEEQNKPGWQVRYTVVSVPLGGGEFDRRLVRQVLDEAVVVQSQRTVIEGLRDGADTPRGFSMTKSGDMWEISVATVGHHQNEQGQGTIFHVHMRN